MADRSILLATFEERTDTFALSRGRSPKRGSKCFRRLDFNSVFGFVVPSKARARKQENVEDESARMKFRALWTTALFRVWNSLQTLSHALPSFLSFSFPFYYRVAFELFMYIRWNGNEEESSRNMILVTIFFSRELKIDDGIHLNFKVFRFTS